MTTRTEHDLLGDRKIPEQVYWGIHTLRATENFPLPVESLTQYPTLIKALGQVKKAAALANADLNLIGPTEASAIAVACNRIIAGEFDAEFPVSMIQGGAGTSTNMNANEVIANVALEHMGLPRGQYDRLHPNEHVNRGQSTNDVYPTALKLATIATTQHLLTALHRLSRTFASKADEFQDVVKVGRTQLQDAVPMTLGQEFRTYEVMLREDIARLREALVHLHEINLGATAIGTGLNAHPEFAAAARKHLETITGYPLRTAPNLVEATQDCGSFVLLSGTLKRTAIKLSKVCNDLRLLSSGPRAGLGEINLPPRQAGSSIMPGKVNPVIPELVNQVAFEIIGNDTTIAIAAEAGQLQLNAFEPIIAYSLFRGVTHLTVAVDTLDTHCIQGITANRQRLRDLVENSIGLVTVFSPTIGYAKATEIATTAITTGQSVADLIVDSGLLTREQVVAQLALEILPKPTPPTTPPPPVRGVCSGSRPSPSCAAAAFDPPHLSGTGPVTAPERWLTGSGTLGRCTTEWQTFSYRCRKASGGCSMPRRGARCFHPGTIQHTGGPMTYPSLKLLGFPMTSPSNSTHAASPDTTDRSHLQGRLGVAKISMMVIAAAAPLTVIGGPALLGIAFGNGSAMPTTFIVVTIVLLLFAVGFVAMTPFVKSAGAFYSYIQLGLGRASGLGAGLVALVSYVVIEAGLIGLLGSGASTLLASYGLPTIPWWVYAAVLFPVITWLGYRNIDLAGNVLAVLLIAEVAIVLILDGAIITQGGSPEGLSTGFASPTEILSGSPGLGIMFAMLAFLGFEASAVFRDEAKDPERTIPRATFIALIVIGLFYALSTWAMVSAVGDSGAAAYAAENSTTMLSTVATTYLGSVGTHIIDVLFVTSVFACVLSFHNIAARYTYSLAARKVFAPSLGVAHPKFGSPARASIVVAVANIVLVAVAAVTGIHPVNEFYTWLGGVTAIGFMLLLILTCASAVVYFRRVPSAASIWRTLVAPAVGLVGLVVSLILILLNLPALVGGSVLVAVIVVAVIVVTFVAGVVIAKMRPAIGLE